MEMKLFSHTHVLSGLKDSGWDMRTVAVTCLEFWFAKIGELGPETIE